MNKQVIIRRKARKSNTDLHVVSKGEGVRQRITLKQSNGAMTLNRDQAHDLIAVLIGML